MRWRWKPRISSRERQKYRTVSANTAPRQPAVNRLVADSSPARGANRDKELGGVRLTPSYLEVKHERMVRPAIHGRSAVIRGATCCPRGMPIKTEVTRTRSIRPRATPGQSGDCPVGRTAFILEAQGSPCSTQPHSLGLASFPFLVLLAASTPYQSSVPPFREWSTSNRNQ